MSDRFAQRVFRYAGIYGLIVLLPQYLIELGIGPSISLPIQRPEHFYGFIGLAVVWQIVFLMIASDVRRFRPLMVPAILEKLVFGIPVLLLFVSGRVGTDVLVFGSIDLVLAVLFVLAFRSTKTGTQ
jgi:hypothetical protein